jgi:hypothetical protein
MRLHMDPTRFEYHGTRFGPHAFSWLQRHGKGMRLISRNHRLGAKAIDRSVVLHTRWVIYLLLDNDWGYQWNH